MNNWMTLFSWMLLLLMVRLSYELSEGQSGGDPGRKEPEPPPDFELTPEQRRWARKAARNYARAQEKKWRRWNEAMFERK